MALDVCVHTDTAWPWGKPLVSFMLINIQHPLPLRWNIPRHSNRACGNGSPRHYQMLFFFFTCDNLLIESSFVWFYLQDRRIATTITATSRPARAGNRITITAGRRVILPWQPKVCLLLSTTGNNQGTHLFPVYYHEGGDQKGFPTLILFRLFFSVSSFVAQWMPRTKASSSVRPELSGQLILAGKAFTMVPQSSYCTPNVLIRLGAMGTKGRWLRSNNISRLNKLVGRNDIRIDGWIRP